MVLGAVWWPAMESPRMLAFFACVCWRLGAGGWGQADPSCIRDKGERAGGRGEGLILGENLATGRCRVLLLWLPLSQVQTSSLSFSFLRHKPWARNPHPGPVPAPGACDHVVFGSGY